VNPNDLLRALVDPTAPLPTGWPSGVWGVFLLFLVPVGGGIPFGVLMARDAGLGLFGTTALYFLSDVLLAFLTEPFVALMRWLGQRVPPLKRMGDLLARFTGGAGLQDGGVRGPLGLILVSFSITLTTGRAAAAAAGHGFISGWTLAIIGDMASFVLVMVSTLWVSSVLGDNRLTIGIVLLASWSLMLVLQRLQRRRVVAVATPGPPVPPLATVPSMTPLPRPTASSARRRATPTPRRRPTRGLHR
jgi:hypothetical protein